MTVAELKEQLRALAAYINDDDEVQIRVSDPEEWGVEDGDYLVITGSASVLPEHNSLVIIGDVPND